MNDLVGKILSVAQEKDSENRNHKKSPQCRRGGLFDCGRRALDIRAMALEEDSDLVGLLIGPTEVISGVVVNFSGCDSVRQGGNCREKLARALAKFRKEAVGEKHGEDDQSEIGFQDVRASQVFEKERVSLQESHDRIDQICEQDRKRKNDDDGARDVNDGKYNREKKDCQQSARCSAIRRNHESPPAADQSGRPSNLCLIAPRARSSEERVLSTATFLTMPPFRPVNPACCEPLRVIK